MAFRRLVPLSAKHPTQNDELFSALRDALLSTSRLYEDSDAYLPPLVQCLQAHGVAVSGMSVVVRTAHPQLEMLVQRWHPSATEEISVDEVDTIAQHYANQHADGTTEVYLLKHGHSDQALYQKSPFAAVELSGSAQSWRLAEHLNPPRFPIFANLAQRSVTEYCVVPVRMPEPYQLMLSISTTNSGGFPPNFLSTMTQLAPYLRLSVAHKLERIMMTELLSAYLGRGTAQQVAAGRIRHGDLQSLEAVIGFIDLRGFTALTQQLESADLLALMSSFYGAIDKTLTRYGGEILKFIGDGLLFVFPQVDEGAAVAPSALDALKELRRRIDRANTRYPETPIRYAAALHKGQVRYGNIGAPARLDFTVIGATVNRTVRLQELASDHDLDLVISGSLTESIDQPNRLLGRFTLTGFNSPLAVYTLD